MVLVIFIVAIVAFCLASVFASMTGQISILPNETNDNNTTIFQNLTNDDGGFNYKSYGSQDTSSYESTNQEVHYDTSNDDSDDDEVGDSPKNNKPNEHSSNDEESISSNKSSD